MTDSFQYFGHKLDQVTEEVSDKIFLRYQDKQYTYFQTKGIATRLANGMYEAGIRKGSKVALVSPNSDFFVFMFFALLKLGAVTIPVNVHQRGEGLSYIINQCDAETIIYSEECHQPLREIKESLPKIRNVISIGLNEEITRIWGRRNRFQAEAFLQDCPDRQLFPTPDIRPDDMSEIIYTSGTTSAPKGAVWNYRKMNVDIGSSIQFTSEDTFYTCLPLFHGLAQTMLFMSLYNKATFALSPKFSASGFWDDINRHQATWFNHIGGIIPILLKQPETDKDKQTTAKYSYGCGAPQDPATWEIFYHRFGVQIVEYYGSTEAGSVTVGTKPGSMGKVKETQMVKLINERDEECRVGEVGEIFSKPKNPDLGFQGYYKNPEATEEKQVEGWIRSGDLAYRDEEGYYYFVGRVKESMRRRGENISPWEIEHVVNAHPAVKESAAVGVPSELGEDDVKICVVLNPGTSLTPEQLLQYCAERMAYYLVPRYVEFKEELPKTSTEKIERLKLKDEGITPNSWDREAHQHINYRGE